MIASRPSRTHTRLFSAASAEFWLVAACCQWPPSEGRSKRLDALLESALDWKRVARLATRHRVPGLVHAAVRDREEAPQPFRDRLSRQATDIARRNLASLAVAANVKGAFEAHDVPFLVLKGLPLAQLAYGDLGMRHGKDIDVLVEPAHLGAAERRLGELGFRRTGLTTGLTPVQASLFQRFCQHQEFVHSGSGVRLELHWRPFSNGLLGRCGPVAPQWVEVGGGLLLPCLPEDELLLNLCLHGAGHAWFRLKWIADVAALLAQSPPGTAADLLESARRRDLDRPVEQALLLCEALFPGVAPGAVPQPSVAGRWLARLAAAALLEEDTSAPAAETEYVARGLKRSRFLLRRSWRYRLEEAQLRATSPIDWQTYALPPSLQFLYPLLRVPLWIRRRWFRQARPRPSS